MRAEQLGVDTAWFPQVLGFDAFGVLGLAAARTSRIRLGSAVIPTYPRHPVQAAQAAQVVQAAAHGRFALGVSPGHRAWIEGTYGLSFDRPIRHAREWLMVVRALLAGEQVDAAGNIFGASGRLPSGRPDVPLILAATGPQLLAVGGELADGVLTWLCDEKYLRDIAVPAIERGARRGRRTAPPLTAGALICVTDDAATARPAERPPGPARPV